MESYGLEGIYIFLIDRLALKSFSTVPDLYAKELIDNGILSEDQRKMIVQDHTDWLNEHMRSAEHYKPEVSKHNKYKILLMS